MVSRLAIVAFSGFLLFGFVVPPGLTEAQAEQCTDANGDGSCNIVDVQTGIAAFLGLLPCTACSTSRFVDNGDGTITDNETRLMWEKKDRAGGIHDVGNHYTWSGSLPPRYRDGTAYTVFLPTLNDTCDGDESTPCTDDSDCSGIGNGLCGHAGYRDWRIPAVSLHEEGAAELDTLLPKRYPCGTSPCVYPLFNVDCTAGCAITECSCTESTRYLYWSSTTFVFDRSYAWFVYFGNALIDVDSKEYEGAVRAVRGPD